MTALKYGQSFFTLLLIARESSGTAIRQVIYILLYLVKTAGVIIYCPTVFGSICYIIYRKQCVQLYANILVKKY